MAKEKLAPAVEWYNRPIDKWNTKSFQTYMSDKHKEKFELPYVPWRSYSQEMGMLKNFMNEVGNETVKNFIDECFKTYKPTPQYPTLNFGFMYSYMRSQVLPKIYNTKKQTTEKEKYEQKRPKLSTDEMIDLL